MQIKQLLTIIGMLALTTLSAQNDFSAKWTAHMTWDTINENPFNGSFKIKNNGSSVVSQNDTLWFGYLVNDEVYDLSFNEGLYSGRVLEDDFNPGDEITIVNPFDWPYFWASGDTLEFCAVVFGVGVASYAEVWFTGDDDPTNNFDCINAVTPEWFSSIAVQQEATIQSSLSANNIQVVSSEKQTQVHIALNDLNGRVIFEQMVTLEIGMNSFKLTNELNTGLYFLQIQSGDENIKEKFSISL